MQFSADTWHDPATFAINRLPGRSVPLGRGTLDGEPDPWFDFEQAAVDTRQFTAISA